MNFGIQADCNPDDGNAEKEGIKKPALELAARTTKPKTRRRWRHISAVEYVRIEDIGIEHQALNLTKIAGTADVSMVVVVVGKVAGKGA